MPPGSQQRSSRRVPGRNDDDGPPSVAKSRRDKGRQSVAVALQHATGQGDGAAVPAPPVRGAAAGGDNRGSKRPFPDRATRGARQHADDGASVLPTNHEDVRGHARDEEPAAGEDFGELADVSASVPGLISSGLVPPGTYAEVDDNVLNDPQQVIPDAVIGAMDIKSLRVACVARNLIADWAPGRGKAPKGWKERGTLQTLLGGVFLISR